MDDLVSEVKNTGSSAFGNSTSSGSSGSSSGNGSNGSNGGVGGWFSNIFNMTIQKLALLLAAIALLISTATVAILLWKSKNSQKWPPEVSKCPDRWVLDSAGTTCKDPYGLYGSSTIPTVVNNCENYKAITGKKYANSALTAGYVPWEGILDGDGTRSSSLKC